MKIDRPNTEPMALATGSPRNVLIGVFGCDGDAFGKHKKLGGRRASPEVSAYGSGVRSAFTLIEAMIAITMTLIIMLALAQGFKRLSDDISQGRARLALSDQLRSVSEVLRNDLANLTVDPDPTSPNNKLGYFMYYDGPVTDYTAATLPINTTTAAGSTTEQRLSASKFGDFDDVLMFTAKANGNYFKGRVPLAIVKGAAAAQGGITYTPTQDDWANSVVIASEFAEIAYFMMPMNIAINLDGDPELSAPTIDGTGSLVFDDDDIPVNPAATFTVPSGRDLLPNGRGNGVPDRMVLCRRVLLIVPSLNVTLPTTPAVEGLMFANSTAPDVTRAELRLLAPINIPYDHLNPTSGSFAMGNAYQGCDLSVRLTRTGLVETDFLPVAANSLLDLANPANRFAHTTLRMNGTQNTSMPLLALTSSIPIQEYALSRGNSLYGLTSPIVLAARSGSVFDEYGTNSYPESGFISPTFLRQKRAKVIDPMVPTNPPTVENQGVDLSEALALNCVAFDLKGYDPGARLLYHAGADGIVGAGGNPATFGVSGTDDLVLSPSDPGYDDSIRYLLPIGGSTTTPATWLPTTSQSLDNLTASTGCFVDLGWGMKSSFSGDVGATALVSPLSGRQANTRATAELQKSGRVRNTTAGTNVYLYYQPTFDSFCFDYETDGYDQTIVDGGTVFVDGRTWLNGGTPPAAGDLALNGIDDNADGVIDDFNERDSSPPINFAMPAIQATIRLEDKQASVIQQIAVTQSLINP